MDEIERAQLETEKFLANALYKHQQQQGQLAKAEATGFCLNCSEALITQWPEQLQAPRWCDADCRDDWEKRGLAK